MSDAPHRALSAVPFEEPHPGEFLFGSEPLDLREASDLLAQAPGRLVVWLGEQASGKTTLTRQLYERQRRAGPDMRFAGSRTLLAFERLAYSRRLASDQPPSPAQRADLGGNRLEILHVALTANEDLIHLLLAELPGHIVRRLADNQLSASSIPLLRRADKLALILDGDRLCDRDTRASVVTRARQLLERLHTAALPHPGTDVALIVTKWDFVSDDRSAMAYWETREGDLLAEVRALDPGAPHLRVAADARPGYPDDDGIAALRSWLVTPPREQTDPPLAPYDEPEDQPARVRLPRRRRA
jgi:Double-GTPase 2